MNNFEKDIATNFAKSGGKTIRSFGLRFDKVVQRIFSDLRISLESLIPEGKVVLVTVTAPIRVPAQTAAMISDLIAEKILQGKPFANNDSIILGNRVRIRIISVPGGFKQKVLGLVHNSDVNIQKLLNDFADYLTTQKRSVV